MESLTFDVLKSLGMSAPTAAILVISTICIVARFIFDAKEIKELRVEIKEILKAQAAMDNRLKTHADYFDEIIRFHGHAHEAALKALAKAAKAEGEVCTISRMAYKNR